MKTTIKNPYSVNNKLYEILLGLSFIGIVIYSIPFSSLNHIIIEIMKNISYGCFASTLVAWLIEIANVRDKKIKAEELYVATYKYLHSAIYRYINIWAEISYVAFRGEVSKKDSHLWMEWYILARDNFEMQTDKKKMQLFEFYNEQLKLAVENVNVAINQIYVQRQVLTVNDLYSPEVERAIEDFKFVFFETQLTVNRDNNYKEFFDSIDVINMDIENYINNWVVIKYYNYLDIQPFGRNNETENIIKAINMFHNIE